MSLHPQFPSLQDACAGSGIALSESLGPRRGPNDESKGRQGVLLAIYAARGAYVSPRYGSAGWHLRALGGGAVGGAVFRTEQGPVRAIRLQGAHDRAFRHLLLPGRRSRGEACGPDGRAVVRAALQPAAARTAWPAAVDSLRRASTLSANQRPRRRNRRRHRRRDRKREDRKSVG